MIFAQEVRSAVKSENPEFSFQEIGRELGRRWKALTEGEKGPYNDKAELDKTRYEKEKEKYLASKAASYDN